MDEFKEITVSISNKSFQRLEDALGKGASNKIAQTAFLEWVAWLEAEQRYMSIPELEANRVRTIYDEMLIEDVPSSAHLSSKLNLIPSRGRYIAHSISYQHPQWWRKRLLIVALRDFQNNYKAIKKDTIRVTTDLACQYIVDQALQELSDRGYAVILGKRSGGALNYDLGDLHRQEVIKVLQNISKTLEINENGG